MEPAKGEIYAKVVAVEKTAQGYEALARFTSVSAQASQVLAEMRAQDVP
jgi:hypothetical protein